MKRLWTGWAGFWATDRSLSALLLLLVLAGLVLPAMDGPHPGGEVTGMVLFTLLFLAGLGTAWTESRAVFRAVAIVVAAAVAVRATRFFGDPVAEWRAGVDCIAFLTLALLVLAKSMRPGSVTRDRLQGAVAAYLLLGCAWASAYEWITLRHPGAFTGMVEGASATLVYFSFVTLTTTGFGDVLPVHPVARALAVAEALTGQLYLAVIISRLVALEIADRRNRR
jgi:hypothetical protein